MKLSERLDELKKQRTAQVTAMEGVLGKANGEGRTFDETEQAAFDDSKSKITAIDAQIRNCEEMIAIMEKSAPQGTSLALPGSGSNLQVVRNLPKGTAFTRYVMSLACAKGNTLAAAEIAKSRFGKETPEVETILRAAVAAGTTTDTTWAQPLAQYQEMAAEFIDLLRPETFVGRMAGFRAVPFQVRMPRQTSGASAGWVGEGVRKPVSSLAFDTVTIPHTKIAVIIAITEELARWSSPSAEATVRQDLVSTVAQFMDQQFVDPTVAAVSNVNPGAITVGATPTHMSATTVAGVTTDLNAAMTAMAVGNIGMRSRYWLMHPRTENYLRTLRTSQDVYAFRDEMNQGRLLGIPFLSSSNMPIRTQNSVANCTYIALVEASEVFLADDGEVMVDISREASLKMDTTTGSSAEELVSLWQNNLVGIRAERYVYWSPRREAAVQLIDRVTY